MTHVLIADASKPSLVMTSEVIKDKIPGAIVSVAKNGQEALDLLTKGAPDLCIVDFDLPDVDGPVLIEAMRRVYRGPILMTAFPAAFVDEAVRDHLFLHNDASGWVKKPVVVQDLSDKVDLFMIQRHRLGKRFESEITTQLIGKAAGRGKRAPKVSGKVVNISLGGACIAIDGSLKVKKAQEFMLTLEIPDPAAPAPKAAEKNKSTAKGKPTKKTASRAPKTRETLTAAPMLEAKLKAKIAWVGNDGQVGVQFANLTDLQKKELVNILRYAASND